MARFDVLRRAEVHLALALVAFLFSLNYILGKIALAHIEPFAFAWLRVAGSALLMTLVKRWRSTTRSELSAADKRSAIWFSVLGVGINQLMFLKGLSLTSAHEAAILITTIPIFTLLGAFALRTERATALKIAGIVIAGSGALLIVAARPHGDAPARVLGDICILINCLAYGLYLVVSRSMSRRTSPIALVSWMFTVGSVIMLPFCATALLRVQWQTIPLTSWLALAGVVIGPTVVAYVLSAWALARADSSVVAAYTYAQPFIATLLAAVLLGERLTTRVAVAALLIIGGVFLSTLRRSDVVAEVERGL